MNNFNPMLVAKINEYITSKEHIKILKSLYQDFTLREFYDFQDDKMPSWTIERGLILIKSLFLLQIILKKSIHIPGIGIYSIKPMKYYKMYSFPDTLKEMSSKGRTAWYTEKIIHGDMVNQVIKDNKILFKVFDNKPFQVKGEKNEKFNYIQSVEAKTDYLNTNIKNYLGLDELSVIKSEAYEGGKEFEDIVKDYRLNQEYSLNGFLEHLDLEDLGFNMKIIEDLIVLIGYIENNKEKFKLK